MSVDNFVWFDITNPTKKGSSVYTEVSPRLSASKITGKKFSVGPIKDVLAAFTLEAGNASTVRSYLWGVGVDWDIPGFDLLQTNFYKRKTPHIQGSGYQLTGVWSVPFCVSDVKLTFSGFFDWVPSTYGNDSTGKINKNFLTAPQLLVDVGNFWGKQGHLFAGVEYQYWINKFGIKNSPSLRSNERLLQYMVKWSV